MMFPMTNTQFQIVYNILSFSLASMMATTLFMWMRIPGVSTKYKSALLIGGLVTFIAAYHYVRIFDSWVDAYEYKARSDGVDQDPVLTGRPFNDAYRYMDWILTVPLLLAEIVMAMELPSDLSKHYCEALGFYAIIMIIFGYPGEQIVEGDLSKRWKFWGIAMLPFLYILHELLVNLPSYAHKEPNAKVQKAILLAQRITALSWLTYPVVYVFPMLGFVGSNAVVAIQVGYCVADIVAKCGVGVLIYAATSAKSEVEKAA